MEASLKFLDISEVSILMGVSDRTLRRLISTGKVPQPVRIGHSIRWPERVIGSWIDAGCPMHFEPAASVA